MTAYSDPGIACAKIDRCDMLAHDTSMRERDTTEEDGPLLLV